ncbi:MAG TPA: hypothetical protein VFP65_25065 [Anaeromyxobacteraceae bacterium]|nr:hypothetical protein [Anaeromyxobacteraceae bacterium]
MSVRQQRNRTGGWLLAVAAVTTGCALAKPMSRVAPGDYTTPVDTAAFQVTLKNGCLAAVAPDAASNNCTGADANRCAAVFKSKKHGTGAGEVVFTLVAVDGVASRGDVLVTFDPFENPKPLREAIRLGIHPNAVTPARYKFTVYSAHASCQCDPTATTCTNPIDPIIIIMP